MKLWLKYLLGSGLGLLAAFILPQSVFQEITGKIALFAISFVRYCVVPLMFFSVAVSIFRLKTTKALLPMLKWVVILTVGSTLFFTLIGLLTVAFYKIPYIPIAQEKMADVQKLNFSKLALSLFPTNGFGALLNGEFLLPCYILAFLVGYAVTLQSATAKQVITLFDAFSKICYRIAMVITDVFFVGMIAISANWGFDFIGVLQQGVFFPLIILLCILGGVVFFVIYPIFLRAFCHELHPYKVLYASFATALAAFFSGDTNLCLPLIERHCKESLGTQRRLNSVAVPIFSIFARGGTALVCLVAFVAILHSYSRLDLSVLDLVISAAFAFGLSFVLGGMPTGGVFVVLAVMCGFYSRGVENGYLILKTLSFVLCSFACLFDSVNVIILTYIAAVKTKTITHKQLAWYL